MSVIIVSRNGTKIVRLLRKDYPIPYYASLFKGKWYNIKQLIGLAKDSKLRNPHLSSIKSANIVTS